MKRRVLLEKTVAVLLGLLLVWGLVEAWAWAQPKVGRAAALVRSRPGDCVRIHRRTVWFQDVGSTRAVLLSTLKPFCRDSAYGATHNSHGFRSPEYTISRAPGVARVSVLGDSYTWGHGVGDHELFTRIAQERLDAGRPSGSPRVEVLNHGVQGARIVDHLIRLRAHVEALQPDLVVIQLLGNDLYYYPWEATLPLLTQHDLRSNWWQGVPPISLIRRTRPGLDVPALVKAERMRSYASGSPEWKLFTDTAWAMHEWSEIHGIPLLYVFFPEVCRDAGNYGNYQELPPELKTVERVVAELTAMGEAILDLTPVLAREGRGRMLAVSPSDLHPNALAHRIAGEYLASRLMGSPWRQERGPPELVWSEEVTLRQRAAEKRKKLLADPESRAELFSSLQRLHPDNLWNKEQLAVVETQRGHRDQVRALYHQLAREHPTLAAPWMALARLARGSDRRALLETAVAELPDEPDSALLLAPFRFADGRWLEGCEMVSRAARNARHAGAARQALALGRRHGCGDPATLVMPPPGRL